VLGCGDGALALDGEHLRHHDAAHQEGIFAQGLEIATAVRHAHEVDHRREDDVVVGGLRIVAEDLAVLACEVGAEGGGERYWRGHGGGGRCDAHPRRAIGEAQRRDAEPGDAGQVPDLAVGERVRRRLPG